jgi:integrase/recombinase XerD
MLERYFLKPKTVDRIRQSWLSESIELYATWLENKGYSGTTIRRRVPILVRFASYAREHGATSTADLPNFVMDFAQQWARESVGTRDKSRRKNLIKEVSGPIRQMLSVILPNYTSTTRTRYTATPNFAFTEMFFTYLLEERGLSKWTVRLYDYALRMLQSYLDRIEVSQINQLSPAILSGFVVDIKDQMGKSCLVSVTSAVRVLLRYLYRERLIDRDLSAVVESPQKYKYADYPRSITWDQVRLMLETVDLRTSVGRRDYAILLLLVTYGLRAREVAAITLYDIDWKSERLRIPERKAGHSTAYPLSKICGNAILEYLKKDRPKTADRQLFFHVVAPLAPLTWQGVSCRTSYYLRVAGVDVPRRGSHTLRHTCVQRLVEAEFSFKLIGDYVGHRSPESTRIYSKVDLESLRKLAIGLGEDLI